MTSDSNAKLESMVNEQAFGRKEVTDLDLDSSSPSGSTVDDFKNIEVSTEEKEEKEEKEETVFEAELRLLSIDKDDIIDMIVQLGDNGKIEEEVNLFGGRVKASFVSTKLRDTKKFVKFFDSVEAKTQVMIDYYYNIYTLGQFLSEYKGEVLDTDVHVRVKFIEDNIPIPVYKALHKQAVLFSRKSELLSFTEVADFF